MGTQGMQPSAGRGRNPTRDLVGRSITSAVFLTFAWAGISGGFDDFPHAHTAGQAIQSLFQFGYGIAALLCVWVAWWPHRTTRTVHVAVHAAWLITCTFAGGLASVTWGDASPLLGLLSGAASLLLALLMIWPLRRWSVGAIAVPPAA